MAAEDATITVTYTAIDYTLTIKYVYADGSQASEDYVATHIIGESYSVESPAINGYNADLAVVEGVMAAEDATITVTYTAIEYTLTIKYIYEDGSQAAEDYIGTYILGAQISVESPVIDGFEADIECVEGAMAAEDTIITVTYTAVEQPPVESGSESEVESNEESIESTESEESDDEVVGCMAAMGTSSLFALLTFAGVVFVVRKGKKD